VIKINENQKNLGPMLSFKIFSPKNLAKKLAFCAKTTASFCKDAIITMVFDKKTQFCLRKLAKIAENSDHKIDPWDR
jgi:hypothetical protein